MNTCAGIARFCDNSQPRPYRLSVNLEHPIRRLCDACREAAVRLDYEPVQVPEWMARGQGKDLSGALVA
jgi:hypothetical protein